MDPTPAAGEGAHPDTWVVIPLFNEAAVIGDVVAGVRAAFANVVCVDDGSTDGSGDLARAAGAKVVRHPVNLGQGAALQTGIEYALSRPSTRFVVTFDADGQHQVPDALAMLERARDEDLAAVFGSRFLNDTVEAGFVRRIVLKLAVWFTRQSTGMRLTDAHNGLRVIRADAASRIRLRQDGMAHASEIVLHIGRTGLPWAEHPVHVLYTDYSRGKGQSSLNSVNILVDLVFR